MYIQSDKEDKIVKTNDALTNWAGKPLKDLALWVKRNHGGFIYREYDGKGNVIG